MRRFQTLSSLVAAATVAMVGFGATAQAADTTTTFTLTGGLLSISAPATAPLTGTTTGSASLTGSLGNVVVTDPRGELAAAWTATVSSTDFTTGGGGAAQQVVANDNVAYSSGAGTAAAGQVGAMVPSVGETLEAAKTASTWAGVGNNTVTWAPTVTFTLLPAQVAGAYSGTITHSVA